MKKIIFASIILLTFGRIAWAEEEILPPPPEEAVVEEALPEPIPEPEVVPEVEFSIQDGDFALEKSLHLPEEGNVSIEGHDVDARSVLAVLYAWDEESSDFEISELIYYPSFSAFYVKCITLEEEKCDYWMYKVNSEAPSVGMDSFILEAGDQVEIYFDDSFFGEPEEDPPPEVVEGPPEEEEGPRITSSGSRGKSREPEEPKEVPTEEVIVAAPAAPPVVPAIVPPPVVSKVAKAEPVQETQEQIATIPVLEPPPIGLSAAPIESGNSPKAPIVLGGIAALLVLIFLGKRFLMKN
ncbi:MAG: DUF4430 domain-containing protein [Patescibacteria group bacterium]